MRAADPGGLERHEGGIIYPRWARTIKNASLYNSEGIKIWWGDLGKYMLRTHLRRGHWYVLTEWDSFWVHSSGVHGVVSAPAGRAVDTHQPGLAYVEQHAVAIIENGRWRCTDPERGRAWDRHERNGRRRHQRLGEPPVTCGCEIDLVQLRKAVAAAVHLLVRVMRPGQHRSRPALDQTVSARVAHVLDALRALAGTPAAEAHLPQLWALVSTVRRILVGEEEPDTLESELGVLMRRRNAAGVQHALPEPDNGMVLLVW